MAKGKKSSGKHYQSKGERSSVARKTILAMRQARSLSWINENIVKSWSKGENPWITVDNPNKEETNKRKIRVRTNDYWGYPKPAQIKMRLS
jgi:hypothetical protein